MNFADSVFTMSHKVLTENGAVAYDTSGLGPVMDLFSAVGAMRPRSSADIISKFAQAYIADPQLTVRTLFYCGDIRGGLGERRTFRVGLKWLAMNHPSIVRKNIELIPFYNRFDSLWELERTPCEAAMWDYICRQLREDIASLLKNGDKANISLLAKWMPSENASSAESKRRARIAAGRLNLSARQYRQTLSRLRAHLKVVERDMSANNWSGIQYEAVPSKAMTNYRNAFRTHDGQRFAEFIGDVKEGKTKINASTLFPYDLVHNYFAARTNGWYTSSLMAEDETIEAQWKALPDYVKGDANILVMADVSPSMAGRPMETSVGLATYFAQRNKGAFHNLYMSFSSRPQFVLLKDGDSLARCIHTVITTGMGYSTNLSAAFDKVLDHAITHNIAPADMPKAICVISDMEIDHYRYRGSLDFVQTKKKLFADHGYELPKLIMWNVEARQDTFLGSGDDILYVSGHSASVFKNLIGELNGKTATVLMLEILLSERYSAIKM